MSKRVECPVYGSRNSASRFESEGCWSCNQARDIRQELAEFEAFMSMDEEARWRELWEKTRDRH